MKLDQHFVLKSHSNLKMGHFRSKISSLGQILDKPCVHSRGHIFSPIIMKLGQNDFLDDIWYKFENGSKPRSLG